MSRKPEDALQQAGYRGVVLTEQDAQAGLVLSTEAAWNQTLTDWRFLLSEGAGFGFEAADGTLVATMVILTYPPKLAWLGMVLVSSEARNRGLGSAMVKFALEWCSKRKLALMLDATPEGRGIYLKLGFKDMYQITRWKGEADNWQRIEVSDSGAPVSARASMVETCADWDHSLFEAGRRPLLYMLRESRADLAMIAGDRDAPIKGYCFGRAGRTATQIGPIVAYNSSTALNLLEAALHKCRNSVIVDVVEIGSSLEGVLVRHAFVRNRIFYRMSAAIDWNLPRSPTMFAAAGPEFG